MIAARIVDRNGAARPGDARRGQRRRGAAAWRGGARARTWRAPTSASCCSISAATVPMPLRWARAEDLPGFSELLDGEASFADVIVRDRSRGSIIISAGREAGAAGGLRRRAARNASDRADAHLRRRRARCRRRRRSRRWRRPAARRWWSASLARPTRAPCARSSASRRCPRRTSTCWSWIPPRPPAATGHRRRPARRPKSVITCCRSTDELRCQARLSRLSSSSR